MQKNIAGVALPSVQSRASVGVHQTQVFQSKDAPDRTTTPDEFIRMTKGITTATAKAVAAGNSAQQEDVIATANLSRKAISDMLTTCKVLIHPGAARAAHAPRRLRACQRAQIGRQSAVRFAAGCGSFFRRSLLKVTLRTTSQNVLRRARLREQ